ncbi:hypothetical protein [Streptomyces sp. NPDC016626]|uniref:hypothetical protein n=1 Tax=Streptomyces sp. NPDC016626 TaxID=3364968 RepID=UPI0036FE40A5
MPGLATAARQCLRQAGIDRVRPRRLLAGTAAGALTECGAGVAVSDAAAGSGDGPGRQPEH